MMNSTGSAGATPIQHTSWPASDSAAMPAASAVRTNHDWAGVAPAKAPSAKPLALPPTHAPLPLKSGDVARTEPVIAAENALLTAFGNNGHPFAKAEKRKVVIDHAPHTMAVTYTIAPGPATRFGAVKIAGLKTVNPGYVERRLRWQRGEAYNATEVEQTRRALIESGLFSTVRITRPPIPPIPGRR